MRQPVIHWEAALATCDFLSCDPVSKSARRGSGGAHAQGPPQDLLPTFRSRKVGLCRITQQVLHHNPLLPIKSAKSIEESLPLQFCEEDRARMVHLPTEHPGDLSESLRIPGLLVRSYYSASQIDRERKS